MSTPVVPSVIQIESIKHDGSLHRRWEENRVLHVEAGRMIGFNNRTIVTESSRASFRTTIPALFYFVQDHWFNIIYLMDEEAPFYYCNIASPYVFGGQKLHYIDYDIDVIVYPDFTFRVVDKAEYGINRKFFGYPSYVEVNVKAAVRQLERKIHQREVPFNNDFIEMWQGKIQHWL